MEQINRYKPFLNFDNTRISMSYGWGETWKVLVRWRDYSDRIQWRIISKLPQEVHMRYTCFDTVDCVLLNRVRLIMIIWRPLKLARSKRTGVLGKFYLLMPLWLLECVVGLILGLYTLLCKSIRKPYMYQLHSWLQSSDWEFNSKFFFHSKPPPEQETHLNVCACVCVWQLLFVRTIHLSVINSFSFLKFNTRNLMTETNLTFISVSKNSDLCSNFSK